MDKIGLMESIVRKIDNGVIVEIGTHTGDFANFILENSSNSTLYCIDPYISYDNYDDAINNVTGDNLYNQTYNRLKSKYGDRIHFIRKFSEEAVNDIPDEIIYFKIEQNNFYFLISWKIKMVKS
jgi:predicted O-methyltransferase YrrM